MSSINSTISQVAASNPAVAVAVNNQSTNSAILYSMQNQDSSIGGALGEAYTKESVTTQLLAGLSSSTLGRNIDIRA